MNPINEKERKQLEDTLARNERLEYILRRSHVYLQYAGGHLEDAGKMAASYEVARIIAEINELTARPLRSTDTKRKEKIKTMNS